MEAKEIVDDEIIQKLSYAAKQGSLATPLSASTSFSSIKYIESNRIAILFQVEIVIDILSSNNDYIVLLSAPSEMNCVFAKNTNHLLTVEIDIDTKTLYSRMNREVEKISKEVVHAALSSEIRNGSTENSLQPSPRLPLSEAVEHKNVSTPKAKTAFSSATHNSFGTPESFKSARGNHLVNASQRSKCHSSNFEENDSQLL